MGRLRDSHGLRSLKFGQMNNFDVKRQHRFPDPNSRHHYSVTVCLSERPLPTQLFRRDYTSLLSPRSVHLCSQLNAQTSLQTSAACRLNFEPKRTCPRKLSAPSMRCSCVRAPCTMLHRLHSCQCNAPDRCDQVGVGMDNFYRLYRGGFTSF